MNRVPRVALLTNAPAPYRTAFYNELGKRCHLLVAFDTKREPDRAWLINESDFDFDWRVTRGFMVTRPRMGRMVNRRVLQVPLNTLAILERFRPDVVVSDELGVRTMWPRRFAGCVAALSLCGGRGFLTPMAPAVLARCDGPSYSGAPVASGETGSNRPDLLAVTGSRASVWTLE